MLQKVHGQEVQGGRFKPWRDNMCGSVLPQVLAGNSNSGAALGSL